eukprot:14432991-Alexandrium_andersonii.AAC.1
MPEKEVEEKAKDGGRKHVLRALGRAEDDGVPVKAEEGSKDGDVPEGPKDGDVSEGSKDGDVSEGSKDGDVPEGSKDGDAFMEEASDSSDDANRFKHNCAEQCAP